MNEFVGNKLGELLAFNRVSTETYEKGRVVLVEALGEEKVMDIEEKNRMHGEEVMRLATEGGVIDITLAMATATEEKLLKMRTIYISGHWNDATELMEWSGFFEGAAIVHWAVMRGAAEGMEDEALLALTEEGVNWHYDLLEMAEDHLNAMGADKVTA
jgi:hypothetical protein